MTFDDASAEAEQEFEIHPDTQGVIEYRPKQVHVLIKVLPRK